MGADDAGIVAAMAICWGGLGTGPQRAGVIVDNKLGLIARWRKGGKGEKRKEGRRPRGLGGGRLK